MWHELGIAPSRDPRAIKLAYAARLKQVHPEDDPAGFQRLRVAYEWALKQAQRPQQIHLPAATLPTAESERPQALQEDGAQARPLAAEPPIAPMEQTPPQPAQQAPLPQRIPPAPKPLPPSPLRWHGTAPPPFAQAEFLAAPAPPQAAATLFELLLKATPRERPAALRRALRSRGWENLDFQAALQKAVASGLAADFERRWPLIEIFSEHYGWQAAHNRIGNEDPLLSVLLTRLGARRRRQHMEARQRQEDHHRRRALQLLFDPPDERAFKRFRRGAQNMQAMRALIAQLQTHDVAVMRYEVNADSLKWWLGNLQANPKAWTEWAMLVLFGVVGGPIMTMLLFGLLQVNTTYDPGRHPAIGFSVMGVSMLLPIGFDLLRDFWRRRGLATAIASWRQRWRFEPRRRRVAIGISILVVLLTLGVGKIPGFGVFVPLALLLLWFWNTLSLAAIAATILAWPLQLPLSLALHAVSSRVPWVALHTDSGTLAIWFPHWASMFLVPGYIRLCNAFYEKVMHTAPKSPVKLALYSLLALGFATTLVWGFLSPKPPSPTAPTPLSHPVHRVPQPGLPPAPVQIPAPNYVEKAAAALPVLRDDQSIQKTFKRYRKQFDALFLSYSRAHPGTRGGWLQLQLTVAPSGEVSDAMILASTYKDPVFKNNLLTLVKSQKFDAVSGRMPQQVIDSWGKPPKSPPN